MSHLSLANYTSANAFLKAFRDHRSGDASAQAGTVLTGPSPSEIPDAVEVSADSPTQVVIRFAYPNLEAPKDRQFKASGDGTIMLTLGEKTGKILEISLTGDVARTLERPIQLDTNLVTVELGEVPRLTANAFLRNASVVATILSDLPPEFRKAIQAELAKSGDRGPRAAQIA